MSKRVRTIIIALAAVLVLGGGLAAVLLLTDAPADSDADSSESTTLTLVDKSKDKKGKEIEKPVTRVEVTTASESFVLADNKDGALAVEAYADLPINSDQVSTLTDALATISANRKLDSPREAKEYGLDKPQATVTVTYADKSTYAFELGDMSGVSDEAYFRPTGTTDVYLVEKSFANTVLQKSTAYIGISLISAPAVKDDDENGSVVMRDVVLTGSVRGNQPLTVRLTNSDDSDTVSLYTYLVETPYYRGANDENAKAAFDSAYSLTAETAYIAYPTKKQKSECGFDKPYSVAKMHTAVKTVETTSTTGTTSPGTTTSATDEQKTKYYNVESHTVTVGKKSDDGQYYVMVDDLNVIYLVAADSIPWVEVTYNDVASTMLLLEDITGVQSIVVTENGKTTTFSLTHDAEAEDNDDMLTVKVDGKQTDTANFRQLYQVLMGVTRIGTADKTPTGTPDMIIRINPLDSRDKTVEAKLYKTSGSRYTCVMLDGDVYAVAAGSVETVSKQMANYLNGKDVLVY